MKIFSPLCVCLFMLNPSSIKYHNIKKYHDIFIPGHIQHPLEMLAQDWIGREREREREREGGRAGVPGEMAPALSCDWLSRFHLPETSDAATSNLPDTSLSSKTHAKAASMHPYGKAYNIYRLFEEILEQ